jgi:uncharacterized protein (TIGR03083 family)
MTETLHHWQTQLAAARQQLLAVLNNLTPEQWQTPVYSHGDTWTVATVVTHLIDSERGMSIQAHRARKGEETLPESFDINRWNAGVKKRLGEPSPQELLALLDSTRAKTLEVMATMKDEDWTRTGRHATRGIITVAQYYETIANHEVQHAADIRNALAGGQAASNLPA